jgi:hypothetical protein
VAGAGSGLVHIHNELVAVLPREHFIRGPHDGIAQAGLQSPGVSVDQRR